MEVKIGVVSRQMFPANVSEATLEIKYFLANVPNKCFRGDTRDGGGGRNILKHVSKKSLKKNIQQMF